MAYTNEVLVLTTATRIPRNGVTHAVELLNLGPNDIWACVGGTPTENKARRIRTGESWALDLASDTPLYCLASTANQLTGAATIVTEVP